jgi:hypothetical protein
MKGDKLITDARRRRAKLALVALAVPLLGATACTGHSAPKQVPTVPPKAIEEQKNCTSPVTLEGSSDSISDADVATVNVLRNLCKKGVGSFSPSRIKPRKGDGKRAGVTADGCLIPTPAQLNPGEKDDYLPEKFCFQTVTTADAWKLAGGKYKGQAHSFAMVREATSGGGSDWVFKDPNEVPFVFAWHSHDASGGTDFFYFRVTSPTNYQALVVLPSSKPGEKEYGEGGKYGDEAGKEHDDQAQVWVVEQRDDKSLVLANHGKLGDLRQLKGDDKTVDAVNSLEQRLEPRDEQWEDFRRIAGL